MKQLIQVLGVLVLIASCTTPDNDSTSSVTIYHGGDIVTMAGDQPEYTESVAIDEGKIIYTGPLAEANKAYKGAKKVDLGGKTMLPGFVDAHGHVWMAGFQALSANLLPPPDGEGTDIPALIEIIKDWVNDNEAAVGKIGWIVGFGYDDAQLAEKRHPNADDLDKISIDKPVVIIHQSGHLGAMNHKALELSGYTKDTPNPPGGIIRRVDGSNEPNGTLEEMGLFIPLFSVFAALDQNANEKIARAGLEAYARFGYTTAQEGRATEDIARTWMKLGSQNELVMDVAIYPDIQAQLPYIRSTGTQADYTNHVRIAGVKISLDGSPQGKTAWLTKPYVVPPPGAGSDYNGYPAFPNEDDAIALVDSAFKHNWQILAHSNGDAAADQFIKAVRHATNLYGAGDRRPVMIHAQTVREDQLDSMKVLGIIPSFFGMHTFYWGDWHRDETLGKERAYRISPAQSALKRDMIFTQHHDAPVALPSSIMILHSVVNRVSRSGDIIGADQRLSPYDALRSLTLWSAYQHFEEGTKGSIETGKIADFVVIDQNPMKIDPMKLMDIQVVETIKEGNTIYKRNDAVN